MEFHPLDILCIQISDSSEHLFHIFARNPEDDVNDDRDVCGAQSADRLLEYREAISPPDEIRTLRMYGLQPQFDPYRLDLSQFRQ